MKEIAFALDIRDDPEAVESYVGWHKAVWPEIVQGFVSIGIVSQSIYLSGNRLFLIMRVPDDFDHEREFARFREEVPRAGEWESLMRALQQPLPRADGDEWWSPTERVHDLDATLAELDIARDPDTGSASETCPILDTHHHLWRVARGDYDWMTPDSPIARDYLPEDLVPELRRNGVSRTIVVQAAETEAETDFLLELAAENDFVAGVCGWLDLDDDSFPDRLAHYMGNPLWKSFRPMLQNRDEPDWILKPRVMRNLAHAAAVGARFEVLTRPPQLPYATRALERLPELGAVLNHLSKPDIAGGQWQPWASLIEEVARLPNVHCKLSGMVTEADAVTWSPGDLSPYVEHVLNEFGPERIMFGSDWPVALLAASGYGETVNVLRTAVASMLGPEDQRKLFHDNGARFYGLKPT